MGIIGSGNTMDIEFQKNHWYLEEKRNQEEGEYFLEFEDFYEMESPKKLMEKLSYTPFYRYFIRYLVWVHRVELIEEDYLGLKKRMSIEELRAFLITEVEEKGKKSMFLNRLADLLFQNFRENGLGVPGQPDKIYEKADGKKAVTKTAILKMLLAQDCNTQQLAWLAMGMNMDRQTVDLFLQKVLLRAGWNVWDEEEFLYYLCFKYVTTQKPAFYQKVRNEIYKNTKELSWDITGTGNKGTRVLTGELDDMIYSVYGARPRINLYEPGTDCVDPRVKELIGKHKYLVRVKGKRRRSALIVCHECLDTFEYVRENEIKTFIESFQGTESYASGKVNIFYESGKQPVIPAGTIFYNKKKEGFRTIEDYNAEESMEMETTIVVEVECEEEAVKSDNPETENGYVKKHTEFITNIKGVKRACNRSGLKTPGKTKRTAKVKARVIEQGELTRVQGKLQVTCEYGTRIHEGDAFMANGKRYLCKKEVICDYPSMTVEVHGMMLNTETEKNTLKMAVLPDGRTLECKRIEHSKIDVKQKDGEEDRKGGPVYRYLYAKQDGSNLAEISDFDDTTKEKLQKILMEAKFSASRLNIIRNPEQMERGKNTNKALITRAEVLVLSFLSNEWNPIDPVERRKATAANEKIRKEKYARRFAEFKEYVDENLKEAGFYPLYLANPIDALLVFLTVFDEPIDMLRNLWNEYL